MKLTLYWYLTILTTMCKNFFVIICFGNSWYFCKSNELWGRSCLHTPIKTRSRLYIPVPHFVPSIIQPVTHTHTHTQLCITDTQTKPLLFQTWLILVLLVSNLSLLGIRGFCHTLFIILSQNVIQLSFFWIFSLTYRLRSFSYAASRVTLFCFRDVRCFAMLISSLTSK